MMRDEPGAKGKGHALRWAMDRILFEANAPEAIVVIDADSIVHQDFLRELELEFVAGSDLVQGNDQLLVEPESPSSAQEAAALLLRNGVRFAGRAALGIPAALCGNGMLLSRRVLQRHPWSAFTAAEDSEYSMTLRVAGIRTTFAQRARVYAAATSSEAGAYTQGVRWDAGRYYLIRLWLGPLLSAALIRRRWGLLPEAIDLAVLPFGVLTVTTVVGVSVSLVSALANLVAPVAILPWAIAILALPLYVIVGLAAARAPSSFYRALLLMTPVFALRKLKIYVRLLKGFEITEWIRTARPAESRGGQARP
jgi:cellulose synthase/poly-beta-1,6-N-acetylglucosamine synthase-like glycosyltransferase